MLVVNKMCKINSMKEMFDYLDTINDADDLMYNDCKQHSYLYEEDYEKILEAVLSLYKKPKRIVDIGSNMNQYAYIFENAGIDYIGIDLWNANRRMKPYESKHVKFIGARYEDISEWFKNDVIISNLCVNYLVKREDVAAKHLITNELVDKKFVAKIWW